MILKEGNNIKHLINTENTYILYYFISIDPMSQKDYVNIPYMGRQPPQTYGHALPMSYPQSLAVENDRDVILSVSGKKKCSYCNNELGKL